MEHIVRSNKLNKPVSSNQSLIIVFYVIGLILSVMFSLFQGTIFALQVWLTVFVFLIIFKASWMYIMRGEWEKIVAELLLPGFLWLLFCVSGLINMIGIDDVTEYGRIEDLTIILMSVFVMIGAALYVLGFRFVFRLNHGVKIDPTLKRVKLLLVVMLLFDWFVRYQLIRDGLYFTWVMRVGFDDNIRGTNFLFHVQRTIWPIIFPLLLYLISRTRNPTKLISIVLLVVQIVFVISGGSRRHILITVLVLIASIGMIYKIRINLKLIGLSFIGMLLLAGILGPMIQEARFIMRRDGKMLLAEPTQIPVKFFSEYLPQVADPELILNPQISDRKSMLGRIGSYMNYGANIYQAVLDGKQLLDFDEFKTALTMIIPRFFYPGKTVQDADYVVQEHFEIGWPGYDANGTYAADVFAYFHFPGIVILFLIAGLGYGLIAKHLVSNYGMVGSLMLIGLLEMFYPVGDSFSIIFINLRNVILFLLIVKLVLHFGDVHWRIHESEIIV